MEAGGNPFLGIVGFWMLTQLVVLLALLVGGIYALYCLGRAAAGLDRLASAMEDWVGRDKPGASQTPAFPDTAASLDRRPEAPLPRE